MIPTREAPVTSPNEQLHAHDARAGEGNAKWLQRCPLRNGVVLLGGSSLVDFRLRYAQSDLRSDLTPSYWSLCGLVSEDGTIVTAPLQPEDIAQVPVTNAVRAIPIEEFDDPVEWPNIAVLSFADNSVSITEQAQRVARRRSIVDLPPLVLDWLAYAWGTGDGTNPLIAGKGIPSAAFVHAAHSLAGLELTPGLASSAACPEAIWQSVKWWHEYYAGVVKIGSAAASKPIVPHGYHALRQRAAAVRLPPDAPLFTPGLGGPPAAAKPRQRRRSTRKQAS